MHEAKWPLRLAIVMSVIWGVIAYAFSYENERFSGASFAVIGLIPLCVLWGLGWVVAGMFRHRKSPTLAFSAPDGAVTGAASTPAPTPTPASTLAPSRDWEPSAVASPLAGPWRRFFARTLDVYVWVLVVGFVVGILNARFGWSLLQFKGMSSSAQDTLAGVLFIPFALVCDVMVYASFGNTIGKGLLGVKVQTLDGSPLPARTYALRTVDVWIRGLGLGIPIVALFTEIAAYRALANGGRTSWDIKYGCRVSKAPRKIGHYLVAVVLFVLFILAMGYGKSMEQRQIDAQNQPPVSWQNPVNQQSAVILPGGWRLLPRNSKLPPNTWLYVDATNQYVVGIGFEQTNMGLEDYTDALLKGNPTLAIIRDGAVIADDSRRVWTGSGTGVATGSTDSMTVRAHVFGGNGGYWRVFAAAPQGQDQGIAQEQDVYRAVSQTTTP
ncbi:RDD family protein [Paraburkholderia hospita]|uniref:RDD family protein n=1 Tax=Paraburkholderia hospita TaxID=169430 RepID=UPI0009A794A2|nr:RDD family protein [Paraburkholderia hospita]SKC69744.1 RDD family protein [Paraburkholderia hospita]